MGYRPEACGMSGVCSCQFVIEANGGVYPCDFYVIDKWYLGNSKGSSFEKNKPVLNRYCSAYMEFFEYAGDRIFEIARMFSQRR